jgi:Tol biopolymer transport system component
MKRLRVVYALTLVFSGVLLAAGLVGAKVPGPNGQIAFSRFRPAHEDFASFTINPNGTHEQRLLPGAAEFPRWAPFGKKVAVLACLNPPACTTAVGIVDPDNGRVRRILMPDPTLFTACPVWSADATRLACGGFGEGDPSRNGIYTIRRSTGRGLTRVTFNPGGEDAPGDYSPDNKQIVFLRINPRRPEGANQALFVVS